MAPPLLFLRDIKLGFGPVPTLDGAGLSIAPGERLCLVGRNGSGKSTLLKLAAGLIEADAGERFVQPGTTVHYLPQEPDLAGFASVLDYVEAGLGPGEDPYRARYVLDELGMSGDEMPARLSGGEARRAALARVLAPQADVLLLDEPTNHLDLPAIEWLEREIGAMRAAVVLISHDRRFLETLSRATVWIDRGQTRRLDKSFAAFEEWRDTVLEEEERERHKLDRRIAAEEHWVRYGVTARRKRNVRRMANLAELRRERRDARRPTGNVTMAASQVEEGGKLVIEARQISKAFGERSIVADFSIRIARRDRVGIVGPNGAGKTTLLNMLTGQLAPDSGSVAIGPSVEMVTLDQRRESLDPSTTLSDTLTGGGSDYVDVAGARKHVVGYMRDFLFTPDQARTPVSALSGGERGRLMLARALTRPANLLVLDEPTNDLDLETLDLLQELLTDYDGTVLVVSHDRDFLDRVATSIIMAEGDGRFVEYAGGYSDMVAQRGAGFAARTAPEPSRPAAQAQPREQAQGAPARRKLSFKEKHALETLPQRMEKMSRAIGDLQARLDDPGLYARDAREFARLTEQFASAQAELASAEDEWLNLEMLREEFEG